MNTQTADEVRRRAAAEGDTRPRLKLIVTIRAFNEDENIADVIREIPREIPGIASVEVLVLDDGLDGDDGVVGGRGLCDLAQPPAGVGADVPRRDRRGAGAWRGRHREQDADNHYDQSRIPELVSPIVAGRADIVVGSREISQIKMKWSHKWGNILGSSMVRHLAGLPNNVDVSSG